MQANTAENMEQNGRLKERMAERNEAGFAQGAGEDSWGPHTPARKKEVSQARHPRAYRMFIPKEHVITGENNVLLVITSFTNWNSLDLAILHHLVWLLNHF